MASKCRIAKPKANSIWYTYKGNRAIGAMPTSNVAFALYHHTLCCTIKQIALYGSERWSYNKKTTQLETVEGFFFNVR